MAHKLYLASGWFTPSQAERQERIYNLLKIIPNLEIFNPKLQSNLTNQKDSDKFQTVLDNNINAISDADIIVAITDEKDIGTLWECGFACAKEKAIIYYAETLGEKPFNLMLAKTGLIAKNMSELKVLLEDEKTYIRQKKYRYGGIIE